MNPGFWMTSGYADNITREAEDTSAGSGYEVVAVPQVEGWLQSGRFRLNGAGALEFSRFADSSAPSANRHARILGTLDGGRVQPSGAFIYRNHYARPTGYEIVARSQRIEKELSGSIEALSGSRISFGAAATYLKTRYDADAVYAGIDLEEKLNRDTSSLFPRGSIRITPITSLFVSGELVRDRFLLSPERDADTNGVFVGIATAKPGIISGFAQFGYSKLSSPQSNLDQSGFRMAGLLTYARENFPLVTLDFRRGDEFSYDENAGVFLDTSVTLRLVQPVGQRASITGSLTGSWMDYGIPTAGGPERVDRFRMYTAGFAHKIGRLGTFGVDGEYLSKSGNEAWTSWRVVGFVTVGCKTLIRLDRPLPGQG